MPLDSERSRASKQMARMRTEAAETERRLRAEADLQRNRLHESFAQNPAAMAMVSGADHRFTFVNSAYLQMSRRSRDELMGRTAREVFPEFHDQGYFELLDKVYQTGEPLVTDESPLIVNKNGRAESFYIDFTYHPLRNIEGKVEGILFQGVDVTAKVAARAELEERVTERTAELAQAEENLRTLNHRLLETQEEERRRLARELHDSAGQWVAALKWKVAILREDIAAKNPDLVRPVSEILHMVDELSKELRTLSQLLHPPSLDEAGLAPALRAYVEGIAERSNLTIDLQMDPNLARLPREIENAVFRIVQESLTNVHRHAHTKAARVRVNRNSETIYIEIQDAGKGIPGFASLDTTTAKMGVGLRGMRERIQQLDGKFEFQSGEGGTTVKASLPIRVRAA